MSEKYTVVFKGEVAPKRSEEEVGASMASLFKVEPERIKPYFNGKTFIKKGLSRGNAERIRKQLENIGCICYVLDEQSELEVFATEQPSEQTTAMIPMEEVGTSEEEHLAEDEVQYDPNRHLLNIVVRLLWLLIIGWVIVFIGAAAGAVLDILLPRHHILGGKIAIRSFNIGTLAWFEGVDFQISMNVNAKGKGIAIKDMKE